MSLETMSSQECLMLIAYLGFLKSLNGEYKQQTPLSEVIKPTKNSPSRPEGAHRPEPVRRRGRKSGQALQEFLSQTPDYKAHCSDVKEGKLKPHRPEPVRRRKNPKYTLEELLAQTTDDNSHAEVDTGPAVGSEV